ncbi:hypothetical protein ACKWTF_004189 [Chironomus riparius]
MHSIPKITQKLSTILNKLMPLFIPILNNTQLCICFLVVSKNSLLNRNFDAVAAAERHVVPSTNAFNFPVSQSYNRIVARMAGNGVSNWEFPLNKSNEFVDVECRLSIPVTVVKV